MKNDKCKPKDWQNRKSSATLIFFDVQMFESNLNYLRINDFHGIHSLRDYFICRSTLDDSPLKPDFNLGVELLP